MGEGDRNRKQWPENRLEELAGIEMVDYTGRLFREGKASISAELAGVFVRLGCSAPSWQLQIEKLCGDRLLGRFFAASRAKLREIAERLGVRRLVNQRGCPIRRQHPESWLPSSILYPCVFAPAVHVPLARVRQAGWDMGFDAAGAERRSSAGVSSARSVNATGLPVASVERTRESKR